MKKLLHFLFFLLLIITYGCGIGKDFTVNPSNDLRIGSTNTSDIENQFGKPQDLKTIEENNLSSIIYTYFYVKKPGYFNFTTMKNLRLEIINNSLNGYIYQNSIETENTDFTDSLREKIIIGESNSEDILNLFGKPTGLISIPTNLINYSLGINSIKMLPEAKKAWVYSLGYFDDVYNAPKPFYKYLIFFLDNNQLVVDKYYLSNIVKPFYRPKVSEN